MEYRVCIDCLLNKPIFDYTKTKNGFRIVCKKCAGDKCKIYYNNNKEKVKNKNTKWQQNPNNKDKVRSYKLKRLYGINSNDYNLLLLSQNSKCAICNKNSFEFTQKLAVDHCHSTGKVRGLLCQICNVLLGQVNDSIEILESAIKYLKK